MSNNLHTHVVIMAGGIGSRLWPLSTPEHPKQFIDVFRNRKITPSDDSRQIPARL